MQTPNHTKSSSQILKSIESQNQKGTSFNKVMSNAKKARQNATVNAQLLANRIALLQHEESKMICKINETRKKTFELYKIKKNNEEWKTMKSRSRNHEDQKMLETQNYSQKYREQHEELRKNIRDSLLDQKKKEALEIRQIKKNNELQIKQQTEGAIIENKRMTTRVRANQFQGKLKMKDFVNNRSQVIKQQKIEKLTHDELTVKQKELEMARMEQLEMELIKKLQNTHDVQKNIYQEYDSLLNESIQEYEKKFKPPDNKKYQSLEINKKCYKPIKPQRINKYLKTPILEKINKKLESENTNNKKEEIESPIKETASP